MLIYVYSAFQRGRPVVLFSGNTAVETNGKQKISFVHSLSLLVLEQYEAREENCQISLGSKRCEVVLLNLNSMVEIYFFFLLKEAGYEDMRKNTFSSSFKGGIAKEYMARLSRSNRNSPKTQKYILSQKLEQILCSLKDS